MEDLRLRCADIQAELAAAKEQSAPLVAKIKELEEERDSFRLRAQEATASAKVTAGQLGAEQSEHQATKVALAEATKAVEASRVEALDWKSKAEGKFRLNHAPCSFCPGSRLTPDPLSRRRSGERSLPGG